LPPTDTAPYDVQYKSCYPPEKKVSCNPSLAALGNTKGLVKPSPKAPIERKKAGVAEHPEVFDHAGLLVNGPPDPAGLPFS
jgi:hypothetical protein